jgi:hypothetical protein
MNAIDRHTEIVGEKIREDYTLSQRQINRRIILGNWVEWSLMHRFTSFSNRTSNGIICGIKKLSTTLATLAWNVHFESKDQFCKCVTVRADMNQQNKQYSQSK